MIKTLNMSVLFRLFFVLFLMASACAKAPETHAEKLAMAFETASSEFNVPRQILESIGYLETRWTMHAGTPSMDNGYGIMHVVDRDAQISVQNASLLTGLSSDEIRSDEEANIRAAAALLRDEADRFFRESPDRDEAHIEDWWQVVMRYSGAEDADVADEYATQVYHMIDRGAAQPLTDGSVLTLHPYPIDVSREKLIGTMEHALTPDYAGAYQYKQALRYSSSSSRSVKQVVIHTIQGSYAGAISWFQNPQVQASAHYVVRSSDGQVTQMVRNSAIAWHAGHTLTNRDSIGIEHEGYVDQPAYLTDAMYQGSANLTKWIANTYNIPKDRQHIFGHNEVATNSSTVSPVKNGGGAGRHCDPCVKTDGSQCFWNWTKYMSLVGGSSTGTGTGTGTGTTTPSTGKILGTVFSSEGGCTYSQATGFVNCTKVVANAKVFIPEKGTTVLSDSQGKFALDLPAGTYTPKASAAGFTDSVSVSGQTRTVVVGQNAWSSFILPKINSGTVKGIVYEINPSSANDKSKRVAGAIVDVGNTTISADTNGLYQIVSALGSQSFSITKSGYETATKSVNVTSGIQTVDFGLVAKPEAMNDPVVTITSPSDNTTVQSSTVVVKGTVDRAGLTVKVNGVSAPVDSTKKFQATVPLVVGANTITALATDSQGNTGDMVITVNYKNSTPQAQQGIKGVVRDAVKNTPISGAQISVGGFFAVSDSAGAFTLNCNDGVQSISVQALKYSPRIQTATVTKNAYVTRDIRMIAQTDTDSVITITSPTENANVIKTITVTGKTSFPVSSLLVNGAPATVSGLNFTYAMTFPGTSGPGIISITGTTTDGLELAKAITVNIVPVNNTTTTGSGSGKSNSGCQTTDLSSGMMLLALMFVLMRTRRFV